MKIRSYLYSLIAIVSFSINLNALSVEAAAARALEEAVIMGGKTALRSVRPAFVLGRRTFSSNTFGDDEPRFAKATYDTSFKYMLEDPEIQLSFLRAFTNRNDIVEVKKHPISVPPLKPQKKNGRRRAQRHMDFACRIEDGDIFIAEVQVQREEDWNRRALYYASGVFSQQLDDGDPWKFLQNVIGINILDHDTKTLPDGDFEKHYAMMDTMHPEKEFWPYLQIRQFELPRVNIESLPEGPKRQWLQIFKDSLKLREIPEEFDPVIKKALKKLDRKDWGGDLIADYRDEELDLSRYASALADERADGKKEAIITVALNMINVGRPLEEISEMTGLSVAQIRYLTREEGRR